MMADLYIVRYCIKLNIFTFWFRLHEQDLLFPEHTKNEQLSKQIIF